MLLKRKHYKAYIAGGITAFCVIAAAIFLFFGLYHWPVVYGFLKSTARILRPIFMGMVIAFLLLPIQRWVHALLNRIVPGGNRPKWVEPSVNLLSILASLFFAFVMLYLLLAMVIPQVYLSVVGLVQAFPGYITSMRDWLLEFLQDNPEIQESILPIYNSAALSLQQWLNSDILPNLESVATTLNWIKGSILPNLTGVVFSVSSFIFASMNLLKDLLIALIVSVYLLARKDIFAAQSKKIVYSVFPVRYGDLIVEETRNAYHILSGFINGKLLDSLIIGIIALICCNLFNFPYPALLATIIGVTNVIPFFGPFIGAIPCALLILLVSPLQCLYFCIFILVLQQFDGNILGPMILGDSTGLASFWVLFSILFFGGLFGFAGMVLGVPVFAMFYSILTRLVYRGLRKHGLSVDTADYLGPTGPKAASVSSSEVDSK